MLKLVVVLLVALGFVSAYEPTRTKMAAATAPVLERLGPAGRVALRPMHKWVARSEVNFIASQIELARTVGREVPTPRSFEGWMRQRLTTRNDGKDPWGKAYYFSVTASKSGIVGSAGPDGEQDTDDDIATPVRL